MVKALNILKKSLLWLGFVAIVLLLVSHIHILMFNDISVEPISPEDNPDFQATEIKHRPPVYLISYVDGPDETYFKNQNAMALSALNKGIDFIFNYKRSHLDPEFVHKNEHILNQPKGAGYWLWKPYVILKTMEHAPENSVIIYADAGFIFQSSIKIALEKIKHHDMILYDYTPTDGHIVENVVKRYALKKMNCDTEACRKSSSLLAGFLILKNTPTTRNFIKQWLTYAQDSKILMDGSFSVTEHPNFVHHKHDQAILCVLYHKLPKGIITMPHTWFKQFAFIHHRKGSDGFISLIPRMYKHIAGIETKIINAALMIKLREFFLPRYFTNHFEAKKPRKD